MFPFNGIRFAAVDGVPLQWVSSPAQQADPEGDFIVDLERNGRFEKRPNFFEPLDGAKGVPKDLWDLSLGDVLYGVDTSEWTVAMRPDE